MKILSIAELYRRLCAWSCRNLERTESVKKDVQLAAGETPQFCIKELVKKSNYIQSKCINERLNNEEGLFTSGWSHKLPLKNISEHYLDPNNWELPDAEISEIRAYADELTKFACEILSLCLDERNLPVKQQLNAVTDFLPPWVVFPLYHASTLGWRMGTGEDYLHAYHQFIAALSPKELELYKNTYPRPCYLEAWGAEQKK